MKNSKKLVTRDSLISMLNSGNDAHVQQVVGRALVAIFNGQTEGEKNSNVTNHDNGIGFTGADAYSGSLSAKSFLKYGSLLDWQLAKWLKPNVKGVPRIAKYHAQLNTIAVLKAAAKEKTSPTANMLRRAK